MSRNERSSPRLPGGFSVPPFGLHQWLALVIVCVALWALGLMWLGLQAGAQWTGAWQQHIRFHIYMDRNGDAARLKQLAERVASLPGVASVRLVAEKEVAEWLHDWLAGANVEESELLRAVPRTIEVTPGGEGGEFLFTDLADEARRFGARVNPGEIHLVQAQRWLAKIRRLLWFVTLVLALAMAIIISNTLRMILLARADEVHLMRLLGAREWFVRMPFLLEGALLGTGAGLLAWLLLWPLILGASGWFSALGVNLNGFALLPPMLFGGATVGCLGAWVATTRLSDENTAA